VRYALILAVFIAVWPASAPAAQLLEGVVASVSPSTSRFVLLAGETLRPVTVQMPGARLPPLVVEGRRLRVRGRFTEAGTFRADGVSSAPDAGPDRDPTGVRSRLQQRRNPF